MGRRQLSVSVQRVYEDSSDPDASRILIDGLWPRGVKKTEWPEGSWRPDVAPSRQLREWYRHEASRFDAFKERYLAELAANPAVADLASMSGHLVLVTATRDVELSHAAVLRDYLNDGV